MNDRYEQWLHIDRKDDRRYICALIPNAVATKFNEKSFILNYVEVFWNVESGAIEFITELEELVPAMIIRGEKLCNGSGTTKSVLPVMDQYVISEIMTDS